MGWKIFFVIFTKLIPRKNFFLYCKNFGVDGTNVPLRLAPARFLVLIFGAFLVHWRGDKGGAW